MKLKQVFKAVCISGALMAGAVGLQKVVSQEINSPDAFHKRVAKCCNEALQMKRWY